MHDVKAFLWYYISNAVINWNINGIQTPDDAKVFGEIYWEENDIILVLESRVGICLKTIWSINWSINGIINGSIKGSINGSIKGSINWSINGSINWSIKGSINGSIKGSINGSIKGSINGSIYWSIKGSINGSIKGSINGSIKGSINGSIKGSINGRKIQTGPLTVQFTYSWLPTKDETSETIVRNLFRPFSWIQSSLSIPKLAYFCLWSFSKSPIVCRNQKSRFKSSYFQSFMSSFQSDSLWVTLYTIRSSRFTVRWRSYLRAELFLQLLKECYAAYLMQWYIMYCPLTWAFLVKK